VRYSWNETSPPPLCESSVALARGEGIAPSVSTLTTRSCELLQGSISGAKREHHPARRCSNGNLKGSHFLSFFVLRRVSSGWVTVWLPWCVPNGITMWPSSLHSVARLRPLGVCPSVLCRATILPSFAFAILPLPCAVGYRQWICGCCAGTQVLVLPLGQYEALSVSLLRHAAGSGGLHNAQAMGVQEMVHSRGIR